MFFMSDTSLNMGVYRKDGMLFIREILNQYAKALNVTGKADVRDGSYGTVEA